MRLEPVPTPRPCLPLDYEHALTALDAAETRELEALTRQRREAAAALARPDVSATAAVVAYATTLHAWVGRRRQRSDAPLVFARPSEWRLGNARAPVATALAEQAAVVVALAAARAADGEYEAASATLADVVPLRARETPREPLLLLDVGVVASLDDAIAGRRAMAHGALALAAGALGDAAHAFGYAHARYTRAHRACPWLGLTKNVAIARGLACMTLARHVAGRSPLAAPLARHALDVDGANPSFAAHRTLAGAPVPVELVLASSARQRVTCALVNGRVRIETRDEPPAFTAHPVARPA